MTHQNKDKAVFEVIYIIPGNRLHGKTHGLYQLGRELLIAGCIKGYNKDRKLWEIQVNNHPDLLPSCR